MMTFTDAQRVLTKFTKKDVSTLYRNLYKLQESQNFLSVETIEEWQSLPFLSKDILLTVPLRERMFADRFSIDHIRASSGTSGNPPVFSPRTMLRGMTYRTKYHDWRRPILAFVVPIMPHWHEWFQESLGHTPKVIVFDSKYPRASMRLAQAAGADSISVFTFHARMIGETALQLGIGEQFRCIEIAGETCSKELFEYIRRIFPHATILPSYNASEVEDNPMGVAVRPITGEEPLELYTAKQSQYHELIDPETGRVLQPTAGTEGELVVTTYPGDPSAFPLIRYRTGDMVRVISTREGAWTYAVLGRVEGDFLKIAGGVLRSDEMERVLRDTPGVTDRFALYRYERMTPQGPKPELILHVETTESVDMELLAREIAAQFRVNPKRTYAEGVADAMYLPLRCVPLQPESGPAKKRRKIQTGI